MRWGLVWLAVALCLCTDLARADGGRDPVAGEALFRQGREAFKRGDFAAACDRFTESQRLDPAAGTALNLSECEERLGRTASAWRHLREAIDLLEPNDDRLRVAREKLPRLEARLPRLTIQLTSTLDPPPVVMRDGVILGPASMGSAQPVDPGEHVIVVRARGHRDATFHATVAERDTQTVAVAPGPAISEPPPAPSASTGNATLGWVATGAGVAALATSGVLAIVVKGKGNDRANLCLNGCALGSAERSQALDLDGSGKTLSTVSTISFAVGIVAVAAGVYLLVTSRSGTASAARELRLAF